MASFWVPDRVDKPELMDAPGLPLAEVQDAYRVLRKVNRQLGNLRTSRAEFRRFLREDIAADGAVSVLDIGSGSGDIPLDLRHIVDKSRPAQFIALDRDPAAAAEANRLIPVVCGDALRLPFADRSVDLVTAVKFAHHFTGEPLAQLLREMTRVARHRVVILDIRRHRLAYWGFRAWSQVFTTNRLVRYDGPLSVLRGFTRDELLREASAIPDYAWGVRGSLGFQLTLIGRRLDQTA